MAGAGGARAGPDDVGVEGDDVGAELDDVGVNMDALRADREAAHALGDHRRTALLDALAGCDGALVLYRPEHRHYCVRFGELGDTDHVAVLVPGVGDESTLCHDWLGSARNLHEAAPATAVYLWKGYDNPASVFDAARETVACDGDLAASAAALARFVASLPLRADQTLTLVAHSFGSVVTGAALAHHGLRCTDVVVAGSPGMTVDSLYELHLARSHFFSEEAPGDAVAELGVFGPAPSDPTFGGTRLRTNAPGHVAVNSHASYFLPGSASLENIVGVVTGRYTELVPHRPSLPELVGGLVTWATHLPAVPLGVLARRYHGAGYRVVANSSHLVDLAASEMGHAVRDVLQAWIGSERPRRSPGGQAAEATP